MGVVWRVRWGVGAPPPRPRCNEPGDLWKPSKRKKRTMANSESLDTANLPTFSLSHSCSVVLAHTASSPSCGTLQVAPSSGGSLGGVPGCRVRPSPPTRHPLRLATAVHLSHTGRPGAAGSPISHGVCVDSVLCTRTHHPPRTASPLLSLSPLDSAHEAPLSLSLTFLTLLLTRRPTELVRAAYRLCVGHLAML